MLLLDGTYLIYKSYYRAKKIKDVETTMTEEHFQKIARNMFLKIVSTIKKKYNPVFMFIVFDGEGVNFRHKLLPTYKSNRKEKPEDLLGVKGEIYHFLQLHNFAFQIAEYVEADDLLASFVEQNPHEQIKIYTGDADLGALVRKNVSLLLEKNKKVYHAINRITPTNCDFIALHHRQDRHGMLTKTVTIFIPSQFIWLLFPSCFSCIHYCFLIKAAGMCY